MTIRASRAGRPHRTKRPFRLRLLITTVATAAALVAVPQPASAAPPAPDFGPAVDPYASNVPQSTCDTSPKPGTVDFMNLVLRAYPGTGDLGISRPCAAGGVSEHKEGRAWDWAVDVNTQAHLANDLLNWLLATDRHGNPHALARRFGIQYIIWNRRIWGAYAADQGWRPYTGDNPHTDHVHFTFSWAGANRATSWWSAPEVPPPLPPPSARRGGPSGFATSWTEGRLDVFGRGGGGQAFGNYFDRGTGASWPDWSALPGSAGLRSTPTVSSWSNGRLDVFAVGSDQRMKHWWFDRLGDNRWRGPETLGTTTFAGPPSVVSWDAGRIDVFARDTNNNLRHNYVQHGVIAWPAWEVLGAGLAGDPAAVAWSAGRWDVFAVHATGNLRHWYFDRQTDGSWHGPEVLGTTTFTGTPAVVSWGRGRIDVFARDTNDDLRHNYVQSGQATWPAWATLAANLGSSPTAVSWAAGRLDVFAVHGVTQRVRQWYFDRAGDSRWIGPVELYTTTFTPTIDAVSWAPGRIDLFGIDTNATMRHAWAQRGSTTGFTNWEQLNGTFQ